MLILISKFAAGGDPQPLVSRMAETFFFRYELTRKKSGRVGGLSGRYPEDNRKIQRKISGRFGGAWVRTPEARSVACYHMSPKKPGRYAEDIWKESGRFNGARRAVPRGVAPQ